MPLYARHLGLALDFVWTFCALVEDVDAVVLAFILSNTPEEEVFQRRLRLLLERRNGTGHLCRLHWRTTTWEAAWRHFDGNSCANRSMRKRSCRLEISCSPLVSSVTPWVQTWRIVTIKKLYGLLFFGFDRTLVLDAEARVVKRMSISGLFHNFFAAPSYWYTRKWGKQDAALRSSLLPLAGLLYPPHSWTEKPRAMETTMGVPVDAFFMDVQHWFFKKRWLVALAEQLQVHQGSLARSICDPPSMVWEVLLAYGFLYNYSRRTRVDDGHYPFYDMGDVLRGANLSSYADRLLIYNPGGGAGEFLLAPLGREEGDSSDVVEKLLSVVDDPRRPIFVFRETNTIERPRITGARLFERDRAAVLRAVEVQHKLVCQSRNLFLSVCQQPWHPYFCDSHGNVVEGMPAGELYNTNLWA